jgi:hypothetical protein
MSTKKAKKAVKRLSRVASTNRADKSEASESGYDEERTEGRRRSSTSHSDRSYTSSTKTPSMTSSASKGSSGHSVTSSDLQKKVHGTRVEASTGGERHFADKDTKNISKPAKRPSSAPDIADHDRVFSAKKARLLNRIVPMTMVPLSTANGMLVVGSNMHDTESTLSCYFPLREFLLVAGATSLALILLAIVCKYLLEWVLHDRYLSPTGKCIVGSLRYVGLSLTLIQVLLLVYGTVILFPRLPNISYDPESTYFCQEGPVIFLTFFLSMCWIFLIFAAVCYYYIHFVEPKPHGQLQRRYVATQPTGFGKVVKKHPNFEAYIKTHARTMRIDEELYDLNKRLREEERKVQVEGGP